MQHEMQRIPRPKSPPVFDLDCKVATGGSESCGNTVIHCAAALDSGEDQNEAAIKSLWGHELLMELCSAGTEWSESKSSD
jgi:hypothetical protein